MTTQTLQSTTTSAGTAPVDYKLEVAIVPVADADRSKAFYASLGWREDADFRIRDDFRILQVTPPGSPASVIFGTGVSTSTPGSAFNLLAVTDIEAAHADLVARGVDVSEIYHGAPGFDRAGVDGRLSGPDPERKSYSSYAEFSDPDGNTWLLQELTTRLPGR